MIASTHNKHGNFRIHSCSSFEVIEPLSFVYKLKRQRVLKSRLLFKKIVNFTAKLQQNYKYLECEISRIVLKHVSDRCFFNLHDCTFKYKDPIIEYLFY